MATSNSKDKQKQFDRLISFVEKLPALPQVTQKALEVLDDPYSTAKSVADEIGRDVVLAGRLLRIANSAFYGFPRRIKSINDAIIILGFETVRSLIMAATVNVLLNKKMGGYGLESGELWRHSLGCAVCAETVARKLGLDAEEAFVSGLMHDVGKVVLDTAMTQESKVILDIVIQENCSFHEVEQRILGYDHAEIGSKIAIKWNLPRSIVRAIQYHHKPHSLVRDSQMASLIKFSDAACMTYGIGIGGEELNIEKEKALLRVLGMPVSVAKDLIVELGTKISDISLKP